MGWAVEQTSKTGEALSGSDEFQTRQERALPLLLQSYHCLSGSAIPHSLKEVQEQCTTKGGNLTLKNWRKEAGDPTNWTGLPWHPCPGTRSDWGQMDSCSNTLTLIPMREQWTGFSFLSRRLGRTPEEKQTLMLGGLPRGKECFHLSGSLGPQLAISEIGFKNFFLSQLPLPQEVSTSWRMADTFVWLQRLDFWPETYKSRVIHHAGGDYLWGPSGSPAWKNFQVTEILSY